MTLFFNNSLLNIQLINTTKDINIISSKDWIINNNDFLKSFYLYNYVNKNESAEKLIYDPKLIINLNLFNYKLKEGINKESSFLFPLFEIKNEFQQPINEDFINFLNCNEGSIDNSSFFVIKNLLVIKDMIKSYIFKTTEGEYHGSVTASRFLIYKEPETNKLVLYGFIYFLDEIKILIENNELFLIIIDKYNNTSSNKNITSIEINYDLSILRNYEFSSYNNSIIAKRENILEEYNLILPSFINNYNIIYETLRVEIKPIDDNNKLKIIKTYIPKEDNDIYSLEEINEFCIIKAKHSNANSIINIKEKESS